MTLDKKALAPCRWVATYDDGRKQLCAFNPGLGPSAGGNIVAVERLATEREAGFREGMETAAGIAKLHKGYDDNLQKSAGCMTAGEQIAAAIRAKGGENG